jgi:Ser/Thr protein kinase RdoA (MazF antagonist)
MGDELIDHHYLRAAMEALRHFPIEATRVEPVAVSENVTFRVTGSEGGDYSLRLHRPGYNSLCELESERLWSAALAEAGLPVQEALPTRSENQFVLLDIPGVAGGHFAGMTSWLPGSLLSDYLESCATTAERQRVFHQIGTLAAKIHNQSARWRPPGGFQRPVLDAEGLLGEEPRWGRFWDHHALTRDQKALLLMTRNQLRALLAQYDREPERFGLIHADLHPDNIILDGDTLGLIDFDDSGYGWHMYDLASALIEHISAVDFETLRRAVLAGYRNERPLTYSDEAMLSSFLLIRGMALIGWFHQRPEHADSAFFLQVKSAVLAGSARLMNSEERRL